MRFQFLKSNFLYLSQKTLKKYFINQFFAVIYKQITSIIKLTARNISSQRFLPPGF